MFDQEYDDSFFTDDATDWELDQLAGEDQLEDEEELPTDAFEDWRDEDRGPDVEDFEIYGTPDCW